MDGYRRKVTRKVMKLTDKQERFAQAIADGMNQSDAYRTAYSAAAMLDATIHSKASVLMADGKVAARVGMLKQAIADKHLWTREDSVKGLRAVADKDEAKGPEIVAAIKELNAMHGFNAPTKHELSVSFPKTINVIAGRA
jgi:phage terminase small subunit